MSPGWRLIAGPECCEAWTVWDSAASSRLRRRRFLTRMSWNNDNVSKRLPRIHQLMVFYRFWWLFNAFHTSLQDRDFANSLCSLGANGCSEEKVRFFLARASQGFARKGHCKQTNHGRTNARWPEWEQKRPRMNLQETVGNLALEIPSLDSRASTPSVLFEPFPRACQPRFLRQGTSFCCLDLLNTVYADPGKYRKRQGLGFSHVVSIAYAVGWLVWKGEGVQSELEVVKGKNGGKNRRLNFQRNKPCNLRKEPLIHHLQLMWWFDMLAAREMRGRPEINCFRVSHQSASPVDSNDQFANAAGNSTTHTNSEYKLFPRLFVCLLWFGFAWSGLAGFV